jgi:hypothetical protein
LRGRVQSEVDEPADCDQRLFIPIGPPAELREFSIVKAHHMALWRKRINFKR